MAEYKQPKTRIKVVEDGNGVRYYPQHLVVLIPPVLVVWDPISGYLGSSKHVPSLGEAKERIDRFLFRHKQYWTKDNEIEARKKARKTVSVIDYP